MSVKLLPKAIIQEQKAKEQHRQIEEGIKVATRIDGLRETYAKTEQDLEKYRTATLEAIGKEIGDLEEKKSKLATEFKDLKQQYDVMLPEIPVKRDELSKFEKRLSAWERKLEKREEKAGLQEIDVLEAQQKAELASARAQDNERITRNLLIQADKNKIDTQEALETAKDIRERAETDEKNMTADFILREFSIKTEEKDILIKKTELMNERKQLEIEKLRVKDQRETLQRSLARLRAGRQA